MSIGALVKTIEADIVAEWGNIEALVVADAEILYNAFKTIWLTLAPSEWAILKPIVEEAISDVFNGDFADLETQVLMKAEAAGVDFLKKLDSAAIQAVLALFVAKPTA